MTLRLAIILAAAFALSAALNVWQQDVIAKARAESAGKDAALAKASDDMAEMRAVVNLNTDSAMKAHMRLRKCLRLQVVAAP